MVNVQDKIFGRFGNRFFQLAYIWAEFREGKIPDIYLQDYKLFDKYKDEIREMFKQEGEPLDYISIHVRRGKNPSVPTEPAYSENPYYVNLLETDYYQQAMAQFPEEHFLIYTDDLNWGENNFDKFGETTSLSSISDEVEAFNQIARCKGHIIANSSYSWWSAYLGKGKTVAPSKWFSNGTRIAYPNDWIVL